MKPLSQMSPVKYSITRLGGGVTPQGVSYPGGFDQTTPSLALQPGALRDCLNFECSQSGGYGRIAGYERFSGAAAPSSATYVIVQVTSFTNVPSSGQVLTQAVSGAVGTIVAVGANYVAVTKITGVFDTTHSLTTPGPIAIGTATPPTTAIASILNAQYLAASADVYRALINPVPGSGSILGVVAMAFSGVDNVYAFRNNVGATAAAIYKASAGGWTLVPLFNTISFTAGGGGGTGPADGAVLTQGANTATVQRVVWQSGTWGGGATAAGQFIITTPAPGNFGAGAATLTGGFTVTLTAIQTAITILPGGKYEFVKCNFSGQAVTRRIYGVDGVNKCFEFDGTTYVPIATGLSPDSPNHIAFHKNFLFISQASSFFYCGVGTPFKWGSLAGGGEIAAGDTINGMITLPGSQVSATLAIFMSANTSFLYGTSPSDFNYVTFNTGTGALPYSLQNLFDTCVMDHLGVITIRTTQNYGNFLPSALTKNIFPFILQERSKLCSSSVNRDRSQYRLFFSDGYALWLTMVNQQYLGAGVIFFPNPVFCCDEQSLSTGGEVTYFGSNDGLGYVYQMDMGTSFDGANIDARLVPTWDAFKSPRILKQYRAASIEMQGSAYASVQFGYQLGYGSSDIGQPNSVPLPSAFTAAPQWDNFVWDNFIWDGQTLSPSDVDLRGTAENIQPIITCTTNYIAAFNINSITYHYTPRRGKRV